RPDERSEESHDARRILRWDLQRNVGAQAEGADSDIAITTFVSWRQLAERLEQRLKPEAAEISAVQEKALSLVGRAKTPEEKIRAQYAFASQKVATIRLPLGATGFRTRTPREILESGYGTSEDKFALFQALASSFAGSFAALTGTTRELSSHLPRPSLL